MWLCVFVLNSRTERFYITKRMQLQRQMLNLNLILVT